MYALVDLDNGTVVPQRGQIALTFNGVPGAMRVLIPDSTNRVMHAASPGDEAEPFKIYEVIVVDTGSGPVVASKSDPLFDPVADTVTVTRVLEAAPIPPPAPLDAEELFDMLKIKGVVGDNDRPRGRP